MPHSIVRNWRWAAVPFGLLYLILLALRFRGIVTNSNLDADAVSAPVIGQLFGRAPASLTTSFSCRSESRPSGYRVP